MPFFCGTGVGTLHLPKSASPLAEIPTDTGRFPRTPSADYSQISSSPDFHAGKGGFFCNSLNMTTILFLNDIAFLITSSLRQLPFLICQPAPIVAPPCEQHPLIFIDPGKINDDKYSRPHLENNLYHILTHNKSKIRTFEIKCRTRFRRQ